MKRVPLTQGYTAVVDDEDEVAVTALRWVVFKVRRRGGPTYLYAASRPTVGGLRKIIYMHRLVAARAGQLLPGQEVDHIDGDTLNNRRSNLRVGTVRLNQLNQHRVRGIIPFAGVHRGRGGRYRARLRTKYGRVELGTFDTPEAAHAAYAAARRMAVVLEAAMADSR